MNDVGFEDQKNECGDIITCKRRVKELNEIHLKYVDDLLIAEKINMKEQLKSIPVENRPQSDSYHARTGHHLSPAKSKVYQQLAQSQQHSEENGMK